MSIKLSSLSRLIVLKLSNTYKVMSKTHKVHINSYVYECKQQVKKLDMCIKVTAA